MSEGVSTAAPTGAGPTVSAGSPGTVSTPPAAMPTNDWTTGFNDELKGYVQTKGFKDPAAVVESYRNFEKLQGVPQDKLLKLPEKDDDPNWGLVWDKLGRPKEAKEYNVEVPPEFGDDSFAEWAKNTFHQLNMPKKQAEALAKKWNEYISTTMNQQKTDRQLETQQQELALKKEWGAAFEQNIVQAGRAAKQLGIDEATLDKLESAMGFAGVVKFVHGLAAKIGEDSFVGGASNSGGFRGVLTPEQATHRIAALKNDSDFVRRYIAGDTGARTEMETLHKMAHPDLD